MSESETPAAENPAPETPAPETPAPETPAAPAAETATATAQPGDAKLLSHNYDGIQEYDNPLPGWWSFLFVASIIFTPIYIAIYHGADGGLVSDQYAADASELAELKAKGAAGETVTNEGLAALKSDAQSMQLAKGIYDTKCAMCHGPEGQGTIGPNLTDEYWVHGAQLVDIYKTIKDGVPAKGMIAWGALLKPEELRFMAAYVSTLVGTNPANPKAPEGEKVPQK